MYQFTPPGTVAMADFDGGAFHRSAPITRKHVEAVLRRISGTDLTVTKLELATSWTDRAFQASAYRTGRVLLAATRRTSIRRWADRVSTLGSAMR